MEYSFRDPLTLSVDSAVDTALFGELFNGFTCRLLQAEFVAGAPLTAICGAVEPTPLQEGDEYTLTVTAKGFAVLGRDLQGLCRGLSAWLLRIRHRDERDFFLPAETLHGTFDLTARMAHLCVFPENTYLEIRKWIRLFGMLQYTHLILEFWGTFPYDSFPEYRWEEHTLTKEQIRTLVREGKALGMHMIPMLNELGHATACRIRSGKHVVLDRHPEFSHLFSPDGWAWDFTNAKVVAKLAAMRAELYDTFDNPAYFHLGLDEAYIYHKGYVNLSAMAQYLGDAVREVQSEGKIPMLWADMLVPKSASQTVGHVNACSADDSASELMIQALPEGAVLCDWQYEATNVPIETAVYLKNKGLCVVGCAWYKAGNIKAYVETAKQAPLFGAMLTTWHTLQSNTRTALQFAKACGLPIAPWWQYAPDNTVSATVIRGLLPEGAAYADFGFAPNQLQPTLD